MNESASKRLRLRFFVEDERAVDEALALTTHSSKSNVIRAALVFYESVWTSLREGFRVVYGRNGEAEWTDVIASAEPAVKAPKASRAHTEASIEIRITPADHDRIQSLLAREAADTASEVVRRAVRLYAAVAARRRDGWDVLAVSPSGDMLHIPVPGMGVAARETLALRPKPAVSSALAPGAAGQPRSLGDLLPRSLAGSVAELAAKEQCAPEMLLVDLIRSEALARLHGFKQEAPEPVPEPVQVAAKPVAAAPVEAPQVVHEDREPVDQIVKEIAGVFDGIDEQVENLMRVFGETARSDGQQELSDLLFAAGLVDNGTAAAIAEDTAAMFSPSAQAAPDRAPDPAAAKTTGLTRLLARATDLRERLVALVSIAAMAPKKGKNRSRKPQTTAEDNPAI
ncbi:MAG TPA: hypothetical protein VMZ06_14960 [Candidatus Bathyarchaeia archaeon]|nr:hypothetical protein [Candidatus Bathyarchaeia archaeon]